MSAIADFRIIEVSKLLELQNNAEPKIVKGFFRKKIIDNYWNFLRSNSKKLPDFPFNGYIFGNLLVFLEEKGINLLKSDFDKIANDISEKRNTTVIFMTFDQKQNFLEKLNPNEFTIKELVEFNTEFSEESEIEIAEAQIEGIKTINESLSNLKNNEEVVILNIG